MTSSPRSLRSLGFASTPEKRPSIYVTKIEFPDDVPKKIPLPNDFPDLLRSATEALGLHRPALHVLDSNHNTITDISAIAPDSHLFISSVAPTPADRTEPIYKSRLPREQTQRLSPKLVTQPKHKPRPENANQHQIISSSRQTVKANARDSLLALFSVLSPEAKAQLPAAAALEKLTLDAQQFYVENSLLSQFIGPTEVISDSAIGDKTVEWVLEKLKGLAPERCRYIVFGPEQSGKSTVLSLFASLFFQKLQLSGEATSYLVVPFNWLFHQLYLTEPEKLYEIVVTTSLNAVRAVRFDLIPYIPILTQWFLSLLTIPTLPPLVLPPSKREEPRWLKGVRDIGRLLHRYWNRKDTSWTEATIARSKLREDDNFVKFLGATMAFPARIATVFDFKSAVLICDHLDVAGVPVEPGDRFPEASTPIPLFPLILDVLKTVPFFAASHTDEELFELLKDVEAEDYVQLSTERIIEAPFVREVVVPQLELAVNVESCRGCPAYCAKLEKLAVLAEEARERAAVKSPFATMRALVDVARAEALKQEFMVLTRRLQAADTEGAFDEDKMSAVTALRDFALKVR
jgi:hypothetical protein